jgi:hypothetical protein
MGGVGQPPLAAAPKTFGPVGAVALSEPTNSSSIGKSR